MNLLITSKKSTSLFSPIKSLWLRTLYNTSYLNKLYECSKNNKTPFFRIDSHHIRIIEDPLDFYLSLIVLILLNQTRRVSRLLLSESALVACIWAPAL